MGAGTANPNPQYAHTAPSDDAFGGLDQSTIKRQGAAGQVLMLNSHLTSLRQTHSSSNSSGNAGESSVESRTHGQPNGVGTTAASVHFLNSGGGGSTYGFLTGAHIRSGTADRIDERNDPRPEDLLPRGLDEDDDIYFLRGGQGPETLLPRDLFDDDDSGSNRGWSMGGIGGQMGNVGERKRA